MPAILLDRYWEYSRDHQFKLPVWLVKRMIVFPDIEKAKGISLSVLVNDDR